MKRPLLLLLPLLAACAGPAANTPQAQCERQAYDDPEVKQLIAQQAGTLWLKNNGQDELAQAKQQAALRCLRVRGLAPAGGVQPVRRQNEHTLF